VIDASEIEVRVTSGEVALSGTVASREAKRRAEDIADAIAGVKEVNNTIRVQKEGQREGNQGSEAGRRAAFQGPDSVKDASSGGTVSNTRHR
jgi:hypothetical protein